uniref:Uncharacterized protein n=1 Tax=Arundo donax TaxID=35708 RepID=A0A0A9ARJ3_ARUDO
MVRDSRGINGTHQPPHGCSRRDRNKAAM